MLKISELIQATGGKLIQGDPGLGVSGLCLDSRQIKKGDLFIAIKGNNFDAHDFIPQISRSQAACVIAQKNKPVGFSKEKAYILVKDTVLALGQIASYQRKKFNLPLIAITGSNGKTTAKDMLASLLSQDGRVLKNEGTKNNHIGLPQTLLGLKASHDFAVLEIGTNHFGEVDYLAKICAPNIGIITNIGESHLEYFKNLSGVFREKSTLLSSLLSPKIAILNADDKFLKKTISKKNKEVAVFSYGIEGKCDFSAGDIKFKKNKVIFKLNRKHKFVLNTLGIYNVYNALAAIACGRLLGLSYKTMQIALKDFAFPKGRLNFCRYKNLNFIDDTYNSNPLSLRRALEVLKCQKVKGRKILVMGDMLELGGKKEILHKEIARSITDSCDVFISVGRLARLSAEEAHFCGLNSKRIFSCQDSRQARALLFAEVKPEPNDIILVKGSRSMKMEEVFK